MKCYTAELSRGQIGISEGLAIDYQRTALQVPNTPFRVSIPGSNTSDQTATAQDIVLCNDLAKILAPVVTDEAFCRTETRIARCNLETRSQLWLLRETPETKNQALVLFTRWRDVTFWPARRRDHVKVWVDGAGGEIIPVANLRTNGWGAVTYLVKMMPGNKLMVRTNTSGVWRHDRALARVEANGTLKPLSRWGGST